MKTFIFLTIILTHNLYGAYGALLPKNMAPNHSCKVSLNNGQSICTGNFVSAYFFKTAAHCLRNKKVEDIEIKCEDGEIYTSAKLHIHPEYFFIKPKFRRDIGFIEVVEKYKNELGGISFEIKKMNNKVCALWGYGVSIFDRTSVGFFHGVRTNQSLYSNGQFVYKDSLSFLVQEGDSGGALLCLNIKNQWIDYGTVYGHDFLSSYILANGFVKEFINNTVTKLIEVDRYEVNDDTYFKDSNLIHKEIVVGSRYKVNPFSRVGLESNILNSGIGDQRKVEFVPKLVIGNLVMGTLFVKDFAPVRYLCDENIICYGTYENVYIKRSSLN